MSTREAGAGSVVAVGLVAALVAATAAAVVVGTVLAVQQRTTTAADAAALAAADVALGAAPGIPCGVAAAIAGDDGATVSSCASDGRDMRVVVTVEAGPWGLTAESVAGPATGGDPPDMQGSPVGKRLVVAHPVCMVCPTSRR